MGLARPLYMHVGDVIGDVTLLEIRVQLTKHVALVQCCYQTFLRSGNATACVETCRRFGRLAFRG